ncbi:MAG: histidinol-phosphatase HisJ family protein [Thomasclavelia sp.]|nr:histidinol-phosphatase HisJ family protein [Thomasclavelia sp.]
MKKYLADYHMHTSFSVDGEVPMEQMVTKAIELGLNEIAITDHVDYGIKHESICDYDNYFKKIEELQIKYQDQIVIKKGIEFGIQKETIPLYERDFNKYEFDFIIMSNHEVGGLEFWNYEFQKGKTQKEYQEEYYLAILYLVQHYKDYSVLGHLDMIKRYDQAGDYPDEKIMSLVKEIFKTVIKDNKGIEINSSSFQYGLKDLTPSYQILKTYYDLGGRIITIGSDSHEAKYISSHFDDIKTVLKEIGFKQYCVFTKMKPTFYDL